MIPQPEPVSTPAARGRPLRVAQLAESPYFGGITSHIAAIAEGFSGRGDVEVIVATLPGRRNDRALFERCATLGTPVHEIPMAGRFDPRVIAALRRFAAHHQIDLFHTHNYRATLLAACAGLPFVATRHGLPDGLPIPVRCWMRAEQYYLHRARRIVACSDFVRTWLLEHGLPQNALCTVHNACPPPASIPGAMTAAEARTEWGIPPDCLVLVYAGRLAPEKNLSGLIEAVGGLAGIVLLIAGEGPLRPDLEHQAQHHPGQIRFLGSQANLARLYTAADAVVLASRIEAFPMTLLEAAAYGKPCLAANVGGIEEVVIPEQTGLLTPPGDTLAFRAAIERLRDPALRTRLGEAALARWSAHFTLPHLADRLGAIYTEALR